MMPPPPGPPPLELHKDWHFIYTIYLMERGQEQDASMPKFLTSVSQMLFQNKQSNQIFTYM